MRQYKKVQLAMTIGNDVALLSFIVLVQQSSSFVFAWLYFKVLFIIVVIVRLANQSASKDVASFNKAVLLYLLGCVF